MATYKGVDPRTRGERYFWHVPHGQPARRVSFQTATFTTGGKYTQEQINEMESLRESHCIVSLAKLDFFCGFLSFVALLLTIPGAFDIDNDLR